MSESIRLTLDTVKLGEYGRPERLAVLQVSETVVVYFTAPQLAALGQRIQELQTQWRDELVAQQEEA